ncbi:zinc carboxypeptidase [Moniliophthora roreri]|nr:zinc carboxypeptidase [Moniliophthora roreri]
MCLLSTTPILIHRSLCSVNLLSRVQEDHGADDTVCCLTLLLHLITDYFPYFSNIQFMDTQKVVCVITASPVLLCNPAQDRLANSEEVGCFYSSGVVVLRSLRTGC